MQPEAVPQLVIEQDKSAPVGGGTPAQRSKVMTRANPLSTPPLRASCSSSAYWLSVGRAIRPGCVVWTRARNPESGRLTTLVR